MFDSSRHLVAWNKRYNDILLFPEGFLKVGLSNYEMAMVLAKRGVFGEGEPEKLTAERLKTLWEESDKRSELIVGNNKTYDVLFEKTDNGGLVISYTDITERKEAETQLLIAKKETEKANRDLEKTVEERTQKLRDSQALLNGIMTYTPMIAVVRDTEGRFTYSNQTYNELFKVETEEIRGKTPEEIFPAELADPLKEYDRTLIETGEPLLHEHMVSLPAGNIPLYTARFPIRDDDGEISGLVAMGLDISELKQAEEALREREQRFRALFHQSPLGVSLEDYSSAKSLIDRLKSTGVSNFHRHFRDHPDDLKNAIKGIRILEANDTLIEMYGATSFEEFNENEIASKLWKDPNWRDFYIAELAELAAGNIKFSDEVEDDLPDGSIISLRCITRLINGHEDDWSEIITTHEDVTERKQAEKALYAAKEEAETANEAKSKFLASMSHELRTPLNAVIGFSQMLQFDRKNPLSPVQSANVENILDGGNQLLELVNDMLELVNIESNKFVFSLEEINVKDVVAECVAVAVPLGEPKDIMIVDQFRNGSPVLVLTDQARLKQVLFNLLSNAVKFNKEGGTVTVSGLETGDGFLRISVSDNGIGIAKENHPDIFEAFHRHEKDAMVAQEGIGIGLRVTKLLVEGMAGRMDFESEEGIGSTFWLEFPLISNEEVVIWSDTLCTGVDAIDRDHQNIIKLINKLAHRDVADAELDEIIREMIEYTHYHFRREEAIMEVCSYPDLEKHRGHHQTLVGQIDDLGNTWREERSSETLHRLRKFLQDWWTGHIVNVDTEISKYTGGNEREILTALEILESADRLTYPLKKTIGPIVDVDTEIRQYPEGNERDTLKVRKTSNRVIG